MLKTSPGERADFGSTYTSSSKVYGYFNTG
jgi:hypothetical protein